MTMCTDWDYVQVRDFEYLNEYWDKTVSVHIHDGNLDLGTKLINQLSIPIAASPLDAQQSKFFKQVHQNPTRLPRLQQQYVIDPE